MKATSFETALDEYSMEGYGFMDEEILCGTSVADEIINNNITRDETPEKNKVRDNQYDNNSELRLVNAYFKEVGCETLLKAKEELEIAAKIKECEFQANNVIKII